jgi:hypothetical protein
MNACHAQVSLSVSGLRALVDTVEAAVVASALEMRDSTESEVIDRLLKLGEACNSRCVALRHPGHGADAPPTCDEPLGGGCVSAAVSLHVAGVTTRMQ